MASTDDIARLRRLVDEPGTETYTDQMLGDLIDLYGIERTAAQVWTEKAAVYTALVNVTESGSARQLSDLARNALLMADRFIVAYNSGRTGTRPIVRPEEAR